MIIFNSAKTFFISIFSLGYHDILDLFAVLQYCNFLHDTPAPKFEDWISLLQIEIIWIYGRELIKLWGKYHWTIWVFVWGSRKKKIAKTWRKILFFLVTNEVDYWIKRRKCKRWWENFFWQLQEWMSKLSRKIHVTFFCGNQKFLIATQIWFAYQCNCSIHLWYQNALETWSKSTDWCRCRLALLGTSHLVLQSWNCD